MKQVVKVSIAGVSFTLENDAHALMEQYISQLNEYYSSYESSQEIVGDIEERIMELLVERGVRERVCSVEDVNSIIAVLGHPKDIEADGVCMDPDGSCAGSSASEGRRRVRKLYRDLNNRVLGGVCGGIAAYFKTDAIAVRLIFVMMAFFIPMVGTGLRFVMVKPDLNIGGGAFGFMIIAYIIFWIIVPPAKTVEQRCAMKGESVGINDIQKRVKEGARNLGSEVRDLSKSGLGKFFSGVGYVIALLVGLLLLFEGFAGVVTGAMFCVGIEIFTGVTSIGVIDYIELGIDNTLMLKIFAALTWFLPFIGFIYAGLALCFKFKSPKWRPGLVIFIVWLVSLFSFIVLGVRTLNPYYNMNREFVSMQLSAKTV